MKVVGIVVTAGLSLVHASSVDPHAYSEPEAPVLVIATDTLRDVAVAVYDLRHPTIYINPDRLQQFGPELSEFFLAHEFGHIRFHHTRANALNAEAPTHDKLIQGRELEADCYAAATLGRTDPPAVLAAVRFFSEMGPYHFDREHPSGSQRAARILACLPTALPAN